MIESRVLGPKTGPERQAGYQTNIPPTPFHFVSIPLCVEYLHTTTLSMIYVLEMNC